MELLSAALDFLGLPLFALALVVWGLGVAALLWAAAVEFDAWCQRRWPTPEEE